VATGKRARTLTLAGIVLLFASSTLVPSADATAPQPFDVPDGMEWDPSIGQFRSDLIERDAAVAAELGADYGVTLGRLRVQEAIGKAAEALGSTYPETFGGLHWDEGLTLVGQFKGEAPGAASRILDGLGVDWKVQSVKFTGQEINEQRDRIRGALDGMQFTDSVMAIDPRDQRIMVTIADRASASRIALDELTQAIEQLSSVPVSIDVVDGPAMVPLTVYGGAELDASALEGLECTNGFNVVSGSGTTGLATAGHCDLPNGPAFYWDWYHGVYHYTTYKHKYVGSWGDFGWYTTTYIETDDFYHNNTGALRDVSSVMPNFGVGFPLNYYGRASKTEFSSNVGYFVDNYVCVYNAGVTGGDSGGPVYWGGSAAGYIMGLANISGSWRMCFSQARLITNALLVTVKTN